MSRQDYSGCHERDAHRIAHEGPKSLSGKLLKRAPKLMPWEVLKRFGIDRADIAACVKMKEKALPFAPSREAWGGN